MIRKANVEDVKKIHKLINYHAKRDKMLPRSLNELYENIRDFFIYVDGKSLSGCCALHIDWEDLAEIKSLAVVPSRAGKGIGMKLLAECLKEARALRVKKVFALTYIPEFFRRVGFKVISKKELPHKIWSECIKCVYFPGCKEIGMLKEI
ncbi:MAG: GNAT family N-acetyltransferase [Omnitrophica bacterium RIFCSPLOWO2_01_FULL_45_10]|nr:MAG: GNAT family N-acetyltransferase [Omnitrophica bacterium RIFCSPLOWO2_01_FULL_45_10]